MDRHRRRPMTRNGRRLEPQPRARPLVYVKKREFDRLWYELEAVWDKMPDEMEGPMIRFGCHLWDLIGPPPDKRKD